MGLWRRAHLLRGGKHRLQDNKIDLISTLKCLHVMECSYQSSLVSFLGCKNIYIFYLLGMVRGTQRAPRFDIMLLAFLLSNKIRLSRVFWQNCLLYLYTKEVGKAQKPVWGVCPGRLQGVYAVRSKVLVKVLSKMKDPEFFSRVCDGFLCVKYVCDKIKHDLLVEAFKIVRKELTVQAQSQEGK